MSSVPQPSRWTSLSNFYISFVLENLEFVETKRKVILQKTLNDLPGEKLKAYKLKLFFRTKVLVNLTQTRLNLQTIIYKQ